MIVQKQPIIGGDMFLSQIVNLPINVNGTTRGVCLGVGVSLKTFAVKYLLCSSKPNVSPYTANADFCVNLSSVFSFEKNAVFLSKLRPVFPKNCAKIFLSRPVYSFEGSFLGNLADLEIQNEMATRVLTTHETFPFSSVAAVSDAVILRKNQPYPLGQRIPAPVVSSVFEKNTPIVTKPALKAAIEKKALIKLTLSLAPFRFDEETKQN